ncbi:MAG: NADH-quinone oxidoreductase subunit J [Coriobacteriia bacterium]|nr:NADH-quinone oxidoreductase subunit J [Coriobacteriia bacterium]
MTDSVSGVTFILLAAALLGGAIGMLFTKNIVHSAFWLLGVSVAASGIFVLLDAEYVALVQLLVYAVAVAILMIFSIMITLRRLEDSVRSRDFSPIALALGLAFCVGMFFVLRGFHAPAATKFPVVAPDLLAFGKTMFSARGWSLPFEIASLMLTAALVGAVWWTREEDR